MLNRIRARRGFTLVELVVIIAIIAALVAVMAPVYAKARERARSAVCASNAKQLSLAVNLYAQDYDEKIPILGVIAEGRGRWMWQILPYVKTGTVYTDPKTPANVYDGTQWADRTGYGWNGVLQAASNAGRPGADGYVLSALAKPAATIIIGDTGYDGAAGWCLYARDPRIAPTHDPRPGYWPQFRHLSGKLRVIHDDAFNIDRQLAVEGIANFCFLDGHAKSLTPGAAFADAEMEDGTPLASPPASEANQPPNSRYVLWNIY